MELVRRTLVDLGLHDVVVSTGVVRSQAEAEQRGFAGSPTILVDGQDPFAGPVRTPGLTCRVYVTDKGLAGLPSGDQLRAALSRSAGMV
jgi:hypothetical protein